VAVEPRVTSLHQPTGASVIDVEIRGVSHEWVRDGATYPVLAGIDLHVRGGEFVALVGPSGSGKSTLLRIVAGLQAPTSGSVVIGGSTVTGPRSDVAMVFQDASLYPWLTAAGNVAFGPRLKGVAATARKELAQEWLDRVGLGASARLYPHQLSGGMKQRVAIARALANGAQVLLMDEPFAALDYLARKNMQELLAELWSRYRKTVLFVTHHLDEAVLLSDRVAVFSPGPGATIVQCERVASPRPRPLDGDWMDAEVRRLRLAGRGSGGEG
jgi:NitT/TauT family transport system ATP-binding protein